jgi:transposase
MSKAIRYTEDFKQEAVAQVIDRGYSVKDTATRLGISTKSMYDWIKLYQLGTVSAPNKQADEIRRLKGDLKRVTEERDILKKAAVYFANEAK